MTYKINGTEIPIQPTETRWLNPSPLGIGANGVPRYPSIRSFELNWDFITMEEWNTLQGFFDLQNNTGTSVVEVPQYAASSYTFFAYSGCNLYMPEIGNFFDEYVTSVVLVVDGIRI